MVILYLQCEICKAGILSPWALKSSVHKSELVVLRPLYRQWNEISSTGKRWCMFSKMDVWGNYMNLIAFWQCQFLSIEDKIGFATKLGTGKKKNILTIGSGQSTSNFFSVLLWTPGCLRWYFKRMGVFVSTLTPL